MKRFTLLVLLAALLAGCGDTPVPAETTVPEASAETTEAPLPTFDFEGIALNVLAAESTAYIGYLDVAEQTGEVLNDAIFACNRAVEERLNIVIEQTLEGATAANKTAEALIMANDHVYDLLSLTDRNAFNLAVQGMLLPYDSLPNVDLTQEYWAQGINDTLRMMDRYWLATGDFNLSYYDYTFMMVFNKQLADDLKLDDPYALVNSGKWTLDAFSKMCIGANRDLNGDSKMDDADQWAWSGAYQNIAPSLWVASGAQSIHKNDDDLPVFTMGSDSHFTEVFMKIYDIAFARGCYHHKTDTQSITALPAFKEGRALFQTTSFQELDGEYYRDMTIDYGILPHPKWDENQAEYYSHVAGGRLFVVPVTAKETEMIGASLEALSRQASEDIIPAYYEIALKSKYTRDDESAKMFDIITDSRIYDLGATIWTNQIRSGFIMRMMKDGSNALASEVEANRAMVEGELQKAIDGFKAQK